MPIDTSSPEFQAALAAEVGRAVLALQKKNSEIIGEKKQLQRRLAEAERSYEEKLADEMHEHAAVRYVDDPNAPILSISREEARDPAAYREAKRRASESNRRLVVSEENADAPAARQASRVKIFETDDAVYCNIAHQKKMGLAQLHADAERKGKQYIAFASADELPSEAAAKHARVLAAGDPEHLLHQE